ncbi:MAG: sigma-70 family RNA polymerase sigma factor [Hyphomicrobiaceae bacterium]
MSSTTAADLAALMTRVAQRDSAAFADLYAATSAKLFGTALRIVKRRDIAEEVVQEAYVAVMQRAGTYDASKGSVIGWMATIVRNRSLDLVRRATPINTGDSEAAERVADEGPDALRQLTESEDTQRLLNCLEALEPERKEMILLAYFHGESREMLGQRFGCPTGTIKTWLHRSIGQLRECMSQ